MSWDPLAAFASVWLIDFEFYAPLGNNPHVLCLAASELKSGRTIRMWRDELLRLRAPPFDISSRSLIVGYYVSAEINAFLALGWQVPARILDLYAEHKCNISGRGKRAGGLLEALVYYGCAASISKDEKTTMRELAQRGTEFTAEERAALLEYCESDVVALAQLLPAMLPRISLPQALFRGRFMATCARVERTGAPIDTVTLARLRENLDRIKDRLTSEVDLRCGYHVYEDGVWRNQRFHEYLSRRGIAWPRLPETGRLDLQESTFKSMAELHPELSSLRELRYLRSHLRLNDLAVGEDGRHRCLCGAYGTKTSRTAQRARHSIWSPQKWIRFLLKPQRGRAIAYLDYVSEEIAVAAVLSGDLALLQAYEAGDVYIGLAIAVGLAPVGATKESHPVERAWGKSIALGLNYGMSAQGLAARIGVQTCEAGEILKRQRETFKTFFDWSERVVDTAYMRGYLRNSTGWYVHVGPNSNPRSFLNWPVQSTAASILQVGACAATESGLQVCGLVHDAYLIESAVEDIEAQAEAMRKHMVEAGEIILGGYPLKVDVQITRYPDRFYDERGAELWETITRLLDEEEPESCA